MNHSKRYVVEEERPPQPKPRWWRPQWMIVDRAQSNHPVIEWFWHYGAADRRARCLNTPTAVDCGMSVAAESHAERWALSA